MGIAEIVRLPVGGTQPRTKGTNLTAIHASLVRVYGQSAFNEMVRCVPDELAVALRDRRVLAVGWYPLHWANALYQAARQVTGRGPELALQTGFDSGMHVFGTIYRQFFRAVPPRFIFSKAQSIFEKVYDCGQVVSSRAFEGHGVLEWQGCVGFDENLWRDLVGGGEAGLTLCGAKYIESEIVAGGGNGDEWMKVQVSWS